MLAELLGHWGLEAPGIVGHDIGAGIVLRAHLLDGVPFHRMALVDAVSLSPWITPFSRHVGRYLEAFATMPGYVHREVVAAHLRSAIYRSMSEADLWPYLAPWTGVEGQAAYYRHVSRAVDERYTDEVEPLYGSIEAPTLILWGVEDGWLARPFRRRASARDYSGICLPDYPENRTFRSGGCACGSGRRSGTVLCREASRRSTVGATVAHRPVALLLYLPTTLLQAIVIHLRSKDDN